MEIHRMKPENPIIIVDEEEFNRIDAIAKLKEEEVERLAEEKFLRHVKNNGIAMRLRINNVDKVIKQQVMTKEQQIKILDTHFQGCLSFWKLNVNNEITAFEQALNDLRDTWRNPYAPKGEMLDRQVTLEVCARYATRLDNLYKEYYEHHQETCREDHIRRCTECGKPMKEGYLVEQGCEYYCSDQCLHKHYTQEQWNCLCCQDGDEEICNNPDYDWDDKEISDENYYTEWESIYQY